MGDSTGTENKRKYPIDELIYGAGLLAVLNLIFGKHTDNVYWVAAYVLAIVVMLGRTLHHSRE